MTRATRLFARALTAGIVLLPWAVHVSPGTAAPPAEKLSAANTTPKPATSTEKSVLTLDDLTKLAMERNPRLAAAAFAVDAARGQALQAGLYPNPTISVGLDELGDRTGPGGVNTIPLVQQELVTGGKLKLSRAVACKDVDLATLTLMAQRYALLAELRIAYFDVVALQRKIALLGDLLKIAEQSSEQTGKLQAANQVSRLDVVQMEVERERLRAEEESAQRELPAAIKRLAAVVGGALPSGGIVGTLDMAVPPYDLDRTRSVVLDVHPDIRSANVGVEKARLRLQRERAQPIPNVTVGAGYVRQNQNKSDDWTVGVSLPIPVWNRNQGNIATAAAQLGEATQHVGKVENDLSERVAMAYRDFASSRQRAERYRESILPRAKETYELSLRAYQGGQFEYLRVLEAQRALTQANLEYIRALGDAWKAASALSGLTLEDAWPPPPVLIVPPSTPEHKN